ncbi:hypothetical protein [Paenibacillus spongiae]|uniref:Lipoprotein n=1 Tax=Paenibacillus spongiae TaxID=2909671 RepID=A0ABY5S6X1_9BACL|nr:hypothetical protein [Paenibacillus spongiae]UVI28570.1 hypothetical protein L1F29_24420 [Paenibacillus spongiae]
MAILRIGGIMMAACLLLTGCSSFYTSIAKDTVMVKKINQEAQPAEVEYNGVLSEDTLRSLSVSAVNSHYGHNLSLEDVQFEGFAMDQAQIKQLLARDGRQYKTDQSFLVEYKTQLAKVSKGIYILSVMNKYNATDLYNVVMNAADGDVIGISKVDFVKTAVKDKGSRALRLDELAIIAEPFIANMDGYEPDGLELDDTSLYMIGEKTELRYKAKGTDDIVLSLLIDLETRKVTGFYKDIMTALQDIVNKYAYRIVD